MPTQSIKRRFKQELSWFFIGAVLVFVASAGLDLAERFHEFVMRYEQWELDEIIPVAIYGLVAATVIMVGRWREALKAVQREQQLNHKLQQALDEISQLKGILPICSFCKRIRDDEGHWQQLETYIRDHSAADFSHGICEDCLAKHYPDEPK
jgi:ABC-type nickel/cobalt efflux system permease component RcnA